MNEDKTTDEITNKTSDEVTDEITNKKSLQTTSSHFRK